MIFHINSFAAKNNLPCHNRRSDKSKKKEQDNFLALLLTKSPTRSQDRRGKNMECTKLCWFVIKARKRVKRKEQDLFFINFVNDFKRFSSKIEKTLNA